MARVALSVGTRLGAYEIRAALGAGGMGEVYRARDTKLSRDVALKLLPELFASDPDRLARFQREAQLLASLNHPNIAAIYGLEETDGVRALVLELVEGPTLAERIAQGPLSIEEAAPIARQITEALEAAHARGIIHRDLKPANIKLQPDGTVKVLDFGLAKALEPPSADAAASRLPTLTAPAMTRVGMVLGTPAYMSPEQAKGLAADKRSDIWALGCVLFEMLSGHIAFGGESTAESLAAILTREPEWGRLPAETPPSIRRLLRRCLEKDRTRRLADMADVRLEIDERESERAETRPAIRGTLRRGLVGAAAGALLATTLWFAGAHVFDRPPDTGVVRATIPLPGRLGGRWSGTLGANLALSPDGRRLTFVATDAAGLRQLWLRDLDAIAARPLADTEDAISPFWSPDGRWLAFVAQGRLRKLDPSGGPVVTLCESALAGGAWNRDDIILFTQSGSESLAKVSAAGGPPAPATATDPSEFRHVYPFFLSDGRRFIYVSVVGADQVTVYLASLDSTERTKLPVDANFVHASDGFLFFAQERTLMAQAFDERRHALIGSAVRLAEQLRTDPAPRGSYFSVSATGMLVYQEDLAPGFELVWFDRAGRPLGTLGEAADYADLTLSPDGRRASVSVRETGSTNRDLWIFDVARGVRSRFTVDPATETHGVWSPDGARIAFDSRRRGHRDLYLKASSGAEDEEVLLEDEFDKAPTTWSPDGRFLLYFKMAQARSIWVLPLDGERKPFPFRTTPFNEIPSGFSPDGRWLASFSTESGRWEVYVSPFPGPGARTQISTAGGYDARWSRDGKEIFYMSPDNKLMVAAVSAKGDTFEVLDVKALFELPKVGGRFTYDVSPDGQRILAVTRKVEAAVPLSLVTDWRALLEH